MAAERTGLIAGPECNREDTGCQPGGYVVAVAVVVVSVLAPAEAEVEAIGSFETVIVAGAGVAFATVAVSVGDRGPGGRFARHEQHGLQGHHACCDPREPRPVG